MNTALIYHPVYLKHNTGRHHPERPARLNAILRKLEKTGLIDRLKLVEPHPASIEEIGYVHTMDYFLGIKDLCERLSYGQYSEKGCSSNDILKDTILDIDTVVSADSFESAIFAAGGVIKAVDLIFEGRIDNAFCMVRPPGHHAMSSQAKGFCIFNNVAIGARYIQNNYKLKRILIIDWDVHHGNGTEQIFYTDPDVFYISLHQYPHYPGTGSKAAIGEGMGIGFNLNIPMQSKSGDSEYINAFHDIIIPKIEDFKPEFILISAGFDGHKDDKLSSLNVTEDAYREMTTMMKKMAGCYSKNRIVSVLEGGYNLFGLANSVYSHIEGLLD